MAEGRTIISRAAAYTLFKGLSIEWQTFFTARIQAITGTHEPAARGLAQATDDQLAAFLREFHDATTPPPPIEALTKSLDVDNWLRAQDALLDTCDANFILCNNSFDVIIRYRGRFNTFYARLNQVFPHVPKIYTGPLRNGLTLMRLTCSSVGQRNVRMRDYKKITANNRRSRAENIMKRLEEWLLVVVEPVKETFDFVAQLRGLSMYVHCFVRKRYPDAEMEYFDDDNHNERTLIRIPCKSAAERDERYAEFEASVAKHRFVPVVRVVRKHTIRLLDKWLVVDEGDGIRFLPRKRVRVLEIN